MTNTQHTPEQVQALRKQYGISDNFVPVATVQGVCTGWITKNARIQQLETQNAKLLKCLDEILNYKGGADNALEDSYVVERALSEIAKARGQS